MIRTDADGGPSQISRGVGNYELIDISSDGRRIYYSSEEETSDISSVDTVSGQEKEVAAAPEMEIWTDVSPDGKSIVYNGTSSQNPSARLSRSWLAIKSIDGGEMSRLSGKGYNARWLPDSRRLAILRPSDRTEGNLALSLIDSVTGSEKILVDDHVMPPSMSAMPISRAEIGVFDFSPASDNFVYLDSTWPLNLWMSSINAGGLTNLTNNTNKKILYCSPRFSADGKRVATVSKEIFQDAAQKPVWRVLISESGTTRKIFSSIKGLRLIGWSRAGELIFASADILRPAPMSVDIIAVSLNGTSRKLYTLNNAYPFTSPMSADGRTFAFTAHNDGRDDIWIASVAAGQPKKVTANSNTHLFLVNLALSPDGKTIFFDKQGEINTISMFENFN
jgi:Tol biopolymer transport system component